MDEDFKMEVTGKYRSSLARQTSEAVQIDEKVKKLRYNAEHIELLNSHSQFHQPKLIKPKASNINYGD